MSRKRRLTDDILTAFHTACDQNDVEVARHLLEILEFITRQPTTAPKGPERRAKESLVAGHERLWQMQHQELGSLVTLPRT
jgi:hypothetical protein